MDNDWVFSWAENAEGRLVHVDSVPNGLMCGCVCPRCRERLVARHGNIKEHGFAHHSENRGANLDICYRVVMYKLAEQILQTRKKIHAPSYYGIFKARDIEFADVQTDSRYEREDKQPDVVATTTDGKQFLIEFIFKYKVQHKQAIDYSNLTCIEVDLSSQSLESLEHFLLFSDEDKRWVNNIDYFSRIESLYHQRGKEVRLVAETACLQCPLSKVCCAVKSPSHQSDILTIENNGRQFRLCKTEAFNDGQERLRQKREADEARAQAERLRREEEQRLREEKKRLREARDQERRRKIEENSQKKRLLEKEMWEAMREKYDCERTCYECEHNLSWKTKGDYAHCGCYTTMGVPKQTPPDYAVYCKGFKSKEA